MNLSPEPWQPRPERQPDMADYLRIRGRKWPGMKERS